MSRENRTSITEYHILQIVKLFRYMTRLHLALFFFGFDKRSKALEILLPMLERSGKLSVTWHNGMKVYSPARRNGVYSTSLDHELMCTEILIRLWRCRMDESEIIPERAFRRFGIVPDFGFRFSKQRGTGLLPEATRSINFERQSGGVLKSKLSRYRKNLAEIEAWAKRDLTVLFVIDAQRDRVKEFVKRIKPYLDEPIVSGHSGEVHYPFFFTDLESFKVIPIGKALTAQIYYWHDGKEYPLSEHG